MSWRGGLSPLDGRKPILPLSLPRRGVWIQHLARQRPAPGRKPSLGGRAPGGPVRSPSGVLQQCRAWEPAASVERIRRPTMIPTCGTAGEWRIPKCGQGRKSPSAGAGRQPPGREALWTPQGSSRRPLERPPGAGDSPAVAAMAPASRFLQLTGAASASQEETARAQVDGRRHGSPKICGTFSSSCLTGCLALRKWRTGDTGRRKYAAPLAVPASSGCHSRCASG